MADYRFAQFARKHRRQRPAAVLILALAAATALGAANIPRKAPDFAIAMSDGKKMFLSQYQGKVVALLFILTTCPHCQGAVRCLAEDQNEFGARGFQALGSAVEAAAKTDLPGFLRQFNPPFPVGYNQLMPVLDFMQHPPMVGPRMPLIAFIDRQGILQAQYEGQEAFLAQDQMGKNIRAKIMELLGEDATKKKEGRPGGPPHSH
jgi:hypothetical protein